jgi:hypothetical protein
LQRADGTTQGSNRFIKQWIRLAVWHIVAPEYGF